MRDIAKWTARAMRTNNWVAGPERSKFLILNEENNILVLLTLSYFSLIFCHSSWHIPHPNSPSFSREHFPSAEQCDWLSLSSFVAVSNFPNGTRASKITQTVTNDKLKFTEIWQNKTRCSYQAKENMERVQRAGNTRYSGFHATRLVEKNCATLGHPIRSKTETKVFARPACNVFPRFTSATWIVCVLGDWPKRHLWLCFYDNWKPKKAKSWIVFVACDWLKEQPC